jgi:hypothetical protein
VTPSFLTLLLPLVVIPVVTLLFPERNEDEERKQAFYAKLGRIQRNFDWA